MLDRLHKNTAVTIGYKQHYKGSQVVGQRGQGIGSNTFNRNARRSYETRARGTDFPGGIKGNEVSQ